MRREPPDRDVDRLILQRRGRGDHHAGRPDIDLRPSATLHRGQTPRADHHTTYDPFKPHALGIPSLSRGKPEPGQPGYRNESPTDSVLSSCPRSLSAVSSPLLENARDTPARDSSDKVRHPRVDDPRSPGRWVKAAQARLTSRPAATRFASPG